MPLPILNLSETLFLDTETTGLGTTDEVVEIAIVDADGNTKFDSLIRPTIPVGVEAQNVHGITCDDLDSAPTFAAIWPELLAVVAGCDLVMYGADFDTRLLIQSAQAHDLDFAQFAPRGIYCAMQAYAEYYGEWSPYFHSYRWHKLTVACLQQEIHAPDAYAHRARGDAEMTRLLTLKMLGNGHGAH